MRKIDSLVIHCSATPPSMDIGVAEIREWHMAPPKSWRDIGYHDVIRRDGTVEIGRPVSIPGAHAYGHNAHSIGVCLVGGVDDNEKPMFNFSCRQIESLKKLIEHYIESHPEIEVIGHKDLEGVSKSCPCFDVKYFWP